MKGNIYENSSLIFRLKDEAKNTIKNNITNSYKIFTENKHSIRTSALGDWLLHVFSIINAEIDLLLEKIQKNITISPTPENNIKVYKLETNSELNTFTSKEVQDENKEITRNFQNEAYDYMNTKEKVENENVALFLYHVAEISRISYNASLKILNSMKIKYIKSKENKISFEDENTKKDFSSWIKTTEKENHNKENKILKDYENVLKQGNVINIKENQKINEYLLKLYYDLSIMYFHCHIAFPLVRVDFRKEDNFNSDKMIDFINRGKNRKVNFVILPALISNGNFLQNGKYWVFTFTQNTFKFADTNNEALNHLLDKPNMDIKDIKDNLKIEVTCKNEEKGKYIIIKTNLDLPEDIEYEYVFYFRDKNNNKDLIKNTKMKEFEIEKNLELIRYEFKLEGEIIISFDNIRNINI